VDVSKLSMEIQLFGKKINLPILIAATAMHKMAHADGEAGTARAAAKTGTIFTFSSLATSTVEEVTKGSPNGVKWFQLYVLKERAVTERLVRTVEAAGFTAILLTVDTPFLGRREDDIRNDFHLTNGLNLELLTGQKSLPEGLGQYVKESLDSSLTWADFAWLKSLTKLPVLVKGVLSAKDAALALQHGADGIIVSNHGARQLDTSPATIDALPAIVKVVNKRVPVLLDGGIRRGTDVIKALALGADAVMIGRPVLWGLSVNGEQGVVHVLEILKEEFRVAMALAGCAKISDISSDLIFDPKYISKL